MKVAAIACLGAAKEDLSYLVEQAAAKAKDVRRAAYHALARIDDPAAVAVLEKAIAGKDLELATSAFEQDQERPADGPAGGGDQERVGRPDEDQEQEAGEREGGPARPADRGLARRASTRPPTP